MAKNFVRLNCLNGSSSKVEEIEFLAKCKEAAGNNSYLTSLFTDQLIDWVAQEIRNDFTVDLFSHFSSNREAVMDKQQVIRKLQTDLDEAKKRNDQLENIIVKNNDRITELKDQLLAERKSWNEGYDKLSADRDATNQTNLELVETNDRLQQQIVALKARLFDLMDA